MYLRLCYLLIMLTLPKLVRSFHVFGHGKIKQPLRLLKLSTIGTTKPGDSSSSNVARQAIEATNLWMKNFVMGNKLCPWVGRAIAEESIRVVALEHESDEKTAFKVIEEALLLANASANGSSHKTTLLVVPTLTVFEEFLELADCIEQVMEDEKLNEHIQIATFHPDYQFEGTDYDDEGNWTNRSPYPVIHLLLVDDVTLAIESYQKQFGSTDLIWKNNIKTMKTIGKQALKSIHARILDQANSIVDKS